jgi:hypothetical protein
MMPRGIHTRDKYGIKSLAPQEATSFDYCEHLMERIKKTAYNLNSKYKMKISVSTFIDQGQKFIIVTNKESL